MSRRLPDLILRTQSDERLLALVRAGHESAFAVLVERYRRPLLAHARPIVGEARAEDAVQDGLTRTWQSIQDGAEIQNVRAWLYRVVHNAALDARRARGFSDGELADTLPGQADTAATVITQAETREMLGALAALPDAQRDAMLMTAVEGRSGEETARMLGVSEGAVHQLVHRARNGLRSGLSAVTPWPLVTWAASGGGASAVEAGGAGVFGMTAVKLSVVLAAGGAAAGGATVAVKHGRSNSPAANQTTSAGSPGPGPVGTAAVPGTALSVTRSRPASTSQDRSRDGQEDRDGSTRPGEDSVAEQRDRGSSDGDRTGNDGEKRDAPRKESSRDSSRDETSGRRSTPAVSDDHPSSSRSGSSGERVPSAKDEASSGSGSSGSGSDSSGSGSSGSSDSSGSGSSGSGSDSSGSGSSGSSDDGDHGGSGKIRSVTTTPSDDSPN